MFWRHGYSNTTVDRVAKTMNMSKPSVYAAFGTKEELYCESLKIFCDGLVGAVVACELSDESLADVLVNLFEREIDFYCQEDPPRGCFLVCTAPAETANCDAIREILSSTLRSIDGAFDRLIKSAVRLGKLSDETDVRTTAMTLQAILHTLAIRVRAGESPRSLKRYIREAVPAILR